MVFVKVGQAHTPSAKWVQTPLVMVLQEHSPNDKWVQTFLRLLIVLAEADKLNDNCVQTLPLLL